MKNNTTQRGFIALMSAIIISSVLILMMVSTSTSSFFARADSSRNEYKRVSLGLAEACTNAAILKTVENFNYILAADPLYAPVPHNVSDFGVPVTVGADTCYITGLELGAEDTNHRKPATSTVQAEYNGAFSNVTTAFTVQNPNVGVLVAPPSCAIIAAPTSLPVGKPLTLAWSSSANATSISVQGGTITTPVTLSPASGGTYVIPIVATSPGVITYTATVTNAGGSSQCTVSVDVLPPPPTPACADVVMVLDRSGSMSAQDMTDERAAASAFLNKYLDPIYNLNPLPFVGVGRFCDASGQSADLVAQLSNSASYAGPFYAINNLFNQISGCYTNLAEAIRVSDVELNGVRHVSGHKKGILLISDGEPNRPTSGAAAAATAAANEAKIGTGPSYKHADGIETQIFTVHFGSTAGQTYLSSLATNSLNDHLTGSTPYKFPSANAQNGSGDAWLTPDGAYGAGYAGDSAGQRHRYSNFGFSIGGNPTINGIEVKVNGWSTLATPAPANTGTLNPNGQGFYNTTNAWTNGESTIDETGTPNCATSGGNADYIQSNTANQRESVALDISSVPNGSTITSVQVFAWDVASGSVGGSYRTFVRNTSDIDATTDLVTTSTNGCTQRSQTINTNITKSGSTALEVGVLKTGANGSTVRVGAIRAQINYTPPPTACTLGVDLSWNGGSTWTSEKTQLLTNTAQTYTLGSASDDWTGSHTWTAGEFSDANFRVRIHNLTAGPTCVVDSLEARVHYPSVVDAVAENADGDHFFITPNSSDMTNVFTTIGGLLCPAAAPACSNTLNDDSDAAGADALDPDCHTDGDASNLASYNANDNDEWAAPPLPEPPVAPPTPPNINIGSWQEKPVLTSP